MPCEARKANNVVVLHSNGFNFHANDSFFFVSIFAGNTLSPSIASITILVYIIFLAMAHFAVRFLFLCSTLCRWFAYIHILAHCTD